MINPNKLERGKGIITHIPTGLYQTYTVTLDNGHRVKGYDLPKRFKLGDEVCIQAQYSIMAESYMIQSIRKAPGSYNAVTTG